MLVVVLNWCGWFGWFDFEWLCSLLLVIRCAGVLSFVVRFFGVLLDLVLCSLFAFELWLFC